MKLTEINLKRLIDYLTPFDWQRDCEIIPAYMPPFPRADTRPRCVIRWRGEDGSDTFLRHSAGPMQGHFWDNYGDDYNNPELAIMALYQAPPPSRVGRVIANHGKPSLPSDSRP
jgi:hypothetical protein